MPTDWTERDAFGQDGTPGVAMAWKRVSSSLRETGLITKPRWLGSSRRVWHP